MSHVKAGQGRNSLGGREEEGGGAILKWQGSGAARSAQSLVVVRERERGPGLGCSSSKIAETMTASAYGVFAALALSRDSGWWCCHSARQSWSAIVLASLHLASCLRCNPSLPPFPPPFGNMSSLIWRGNAEMLCGRMGPRPIGCSPQGNRCEKLRQTPGQIKAADAATHPPRSDGSSATPLFLPCPLSCLLVVCLPAASRGREQMDPLQGTG